MYALYLCKSLFLEHMWIAINMDVLVLNEVVNEWDVMALVEYCWRSKWWFLGGKGTINVVSRWWL